jgi:DedD protein
VGAYVEAAKLRDARQKVESLGFKTYTQVVGAKDAQRTRVRVGPFANKAEAQKAADKIKKLSLPAAILEL